jgi:phosphatidate cytidylyltransferase
MKPFFDPQLKYYLVFLLGGLTLATVIGQVLQWRCSGVSSPTIQNLNYRIYAWWAMVFLILLVLWIGKTYVIVFFGLVSFLALREFISLFPTRRADHRTLFWAFFVIVPLQYVLIYTQWYGLMSIFIPVYAFIFLTIRSVLHGDVTDFLARTSKIQWSLMVCVYALSHIPALMLLTLPGETTASVKLVLFLITVTQSSDIFQYVFGKLIGKHPVAPTVSPNKTVEGLIGGFIVSTLIGLLLFPLTPFSWWQAGIISFLISFLGFCGGLVMSAIKRDQGVKDYGLCIPGHGGILDRIDSLCFSAPVFFHLVRYFFSAT